MKKNKPVKRFVIRLFIFLSILAPLADLDSPQAAALTSLLSFSGDGETQFGVWQSSGFILTGRWLPGAVLTVQAKLTVADSHLQGLADYGIKPDSLCLLLTAERTFDADGRLRLAGDERMSTLLTPSGLAIEGGVSGAVTNRFGYDWRTPVDEFLVKPLSAAVEQGSSTEMTFGVWTRLPQDLPPGIYRLRFDYGVRVGSRTFSLNGESFAVRSFQYPAESHHFSPPIPADGTHISGRPVDASQISCRIPWVILGGYNSNGYRGVVAEEDKPHFALSNRNIIQDDVILPLYDDAGRKKSYSLEPQFPADIIDACSNIPWNYYSGQLLVSIIQPDGRTILVGPYPFAGKSGLFPTTGRPELTAWTPSGYGLYTVKLNGWVADIWGNVYRGGGTYTFWIAKRMTLATATFQGISYPVGSRYGRDLAFSPAVPADVEVNAALYVDSDPQNARTLSYSGQASPSGVFGSAQGAKPFVLDAAGEYFAHILATYTDPEGHLWVCTMRHAGVVYPESSAVVARGKKLPLKGKYVDRGETHFEGYVDTDTKTNYLAHINFPFLAGDVLLIASEQQGANKIEPVLTVEVKDRPEAWDPRLNSLGATNLRIRTSNGYSPHLFPEYITDWAYYYASAPRPGFMSRFLVGENGVRAPYWPTSPNSFGGQIGTSANGDLPGDIYRLLGGVVVRKQEEPPQYAGYMSSAFLLPKGTNNNRIIGPGSEDLIGSDGRKSRLFLVSLRPGMVYETGAGLTPVAQIDPILPASVVFTLTYPDGRQMTATGMGDAFGSFAGKDRWTLDVPGVYKYWIEAEWQGTKGFMPGLPASGGIFYVLEKDRPPSSEQGLKLDLAGQQTFSASKPFVITGSSTAASVHYAAVIPGAVIDQGELAVSGGKFRYTFDPVAVNARFPTYDIINLVNGRPEIGKIVHLTFFSKETGPAGTSYHAFCRVIFRGTTALYVR